jgi:hypothetical protein
MTSDYAPPRPGAEGVSVDPQPEASAWWAVLAVALVFGFAACVFFRFWPGRRRKWE